MILKIDTSQDGVVDFVKLRSIILQNYYNFYNPAIPNDVSNLTNLRTGVSISQQRKYIFKIKSVRGYLYGLNLALPNSQIIAGLINIDTHSFLSLIDSVNNLNTNIYDQNDFTFSGGAPVPSTTTKEQVIQQAQVVSDHEILFKDFKTFNFAGTGVSGNFFCFVPQSLSLSTARSTILPVSFLNTGNQNGTNNIESEFFIERSRGIVVPNFSVGNTIFNEQINMSTGNFPVSTNEFVYKSYIDAGVNPVSDTGLSIMIQFHCDIWQSTKTFG